jgi:hypothetical protein
MADISMCLDTACPLAKSCYRMQAEPDHEWQSYFKESPRQKDDSCEYYWHIKPNVPKIVSKNKRKKRRHV